MFPVRIILVRPSHPGNIGSVARAMKTMGLTELVLVAPEKFPSEEATALSTHAADILNQAVVVKNTVDALESITYVYATSANTRAVELSCFSPREAAADIKSKINHTHKTAILFGPENHGLSNEELLLANALIQIPTQKDYHSLNLASAVQIIAYELLLASESSEFATVPELDGFYSQLEALCERVAFLDPARPGQLMERFRRLYNRAALDHVEINILRGFLKAVASKLDKLDI
ncbi:MAG TPA: RNA methyltransferase [Gammaproteobacteria bacterium]|nr:RNA methyltransferase [Gammaproteobacteria bacterium]